MSRSILVAYLALAVTAVGCNTPSSNGAPAAAAPATAAPTGSAGVGTIDLDEISEKIGILSQIQQEDARLGQEVVKVGQQKEQELKAMRAKFGDKPNEEQMKQLETFVRESRKTIEDLRNRASQSFQEYRNRKINELKIRVKIPAETVIKQRGLQMVLYHRADAGGPIYWRSDSIDITDEVLDLVVGGTATAPAAQSTAAKPPLSGK